MGSKEFDEFDPTIERLSALLDLKPLGRYRLALDGTKPEGAGIRIHFYERGATRLKFISIYWSPITRAFKEGLYEADLLHTTDTRAAINSRIRESVVLEGFGDIFALSDAATCRRVFELFELATLLQFVPYETYVEGMILTGVGAPPTPALRQRSVFITGSFGSKLTQEFLANYAGMLRTGQSFLRNDQTYLLRNDHPNGETLSVDVRAVRYPRDLRSSLLQREYYWYALSNQLVLLQHHTFDPFVEETAQPTPRPPERDVLTAPGTPRRELIEHSTLVSFFDPNDVIGFRIPPRRVDGAPFAREVYNVAVPVVERHSAIVKLADPEQAHNGAKAHPIVLRAIALGWE